MNSVDIYGVTDTISSDSQYQNALKTAFNAFKEAMEIFNDPKFESKEDWKKEAQSEGATVHSKYFDYGKSYGELQVRWDDMFREDWEDVNHISDWNNNIAFAKIVHQITPNFDIVNYANNDVMVVKGRDFVVARLKRTVNGSGYIVAKSIDLPELPEIQNFVRGWIHLGAGRFAPHPTKPNVTIIDYIMCIDLKGYIPKMLVNTVMAKLVLKDYEQNKLHFEKKGVKK
uniref:START domain-containing protein n=1 Tax=Acrobeloides nanus TaxID=290746 RepID=A0A914D4N9_9BILA